MLLLIIVVVQQPSRENNHNISRNFFRKWVSRCFHEEDVCGWLKSVLAFLLVLNIGWWRGEEGGFFYYGRFLYYYFFSMYIVSWWRWQNDSNDTITYYGGCTLYNHTAIKQPQFLPNGRKAEFQFTRINIICFSWFQIAALYYWTAWDIVPETMPSCWLSSINAFSITRSRKVR